MSDDIKIQWFIVNIDFMLFPTALLHAGLTKYKYSLQVAFLSFFDNELAD